MPKNLNRLVTGLPILAMVAVLRVQGQTLKLARVYSSGPYSLEQLRKLGHPYAKRHGTSELPPDLINVQGDTFRQDWESDVPRFVGGDPVGSVWNADPNAAFLEQKDGGGKSTMFARPIGERLQAEADELLDAEMERAMDRLFS